MKKIIVTLGLLIYCSMGLVQHVEANGSQQYMESDSVVDDSLRIRKEECQMQIDSLRKENINQMDDKLMEYMKQNDIKKYVIKIACFIIAVVIFLFSIFAILLWKIYRNLSKRIREQEKWIKDRQNKKTVDDSDIIDSLVSNKVKFVKEEIKDDLRKEFIANRVSVIKKKKKDDATKSFPEKTQEKGSKSIYAKPRRDGQLKTTSEKSEAIYIIRCEDNFMGDFELYDDQEQMLKAIKNREDCLDAFCNVKGSAVDAKRIKTLLPGKVEQWEDGIWKIVKKVEVEFNK